MKPRNVCSSCVRVTRELYLGSAGARTSDGFHGPTLSARQDSRAGLCQHVPVAAPGGGGGREAVPFREDQAAGEPEASCGCGQQQRRWRGLCADDDAIQDSGPAQERPQHASKVGGSLVRIRATATAEIFGNYV